MDLQHYPRGRDAGRRYLERPACQSAARRLGLRAVLLTGPGSTLQSDDQILVRAYAPHSILFRHALAIIHHGGIGTTGLAMQSGRPTLIMPTAWDQPDNAARAARLGIARVIPRPRYTTPRVASELRHLLSDAYRQRASTVGDQISREDGVRAACDAIEAHLDRTAPA